jgi:hypothetical protein
LVANANNEASGGATLTQQHHPHSSPMATRLVRSTPVLATSLSTASPNSNNNGNGNGNGHNIDSHNNNNTDNNNNNNNGANVITPLAQRRSGSIGLLPPSMAMAAMVSHPLSSGTTTYQSSTPRPSEDRPIVKLSIHLLKTFNLINQKYYAQKKKRQPTAEDKRRGSVQSKEKKQRHNGGYDDDEYNYIIRYCYLCLASSSLFTSYIYVGQ